MPAKRYRKNDIATWIVVAKSGWNGGAGDGQWAIRNGIDIFAAQPPAIAHRIQPNVFENECKKNA